MPAAADQHRGGQQEPQMQRRERRRHRSLRPQRQQPAGEPPGDPGDGETDQLHPPRHNPAACRQRRIVAQQPRRPAMP
jgi:hypothetical protein